MYLHMFYIQWHHLVKKDLWNKVYILFVLFYSILSCPIHRLRTELLSQLIFFPVALVRERTIPYEQPAYVGEIIANFCG
jgi:hypothetical protein